MLMVGNDGTASWNMVTLIAVLRRSGSVMMSALIFILFSFFFFFFFLVWLCMTWRKGTSTNPPRVKREA